MSESESERPTVTERVHASFTARTDSVPAARHYTTDQLSKWGMADHAGTAGLIVSELASNVVRHAESGFELELSHTDDTVRIVVSDDSNDPPVLRDPRPETHGGMGLYLISKLAVDWGFDLLGDGKRVWARLVPTELGRAPSLPARDRDAGAGTAEPAPG